MKGRKLTLEEVLNLEDGTKVWVEDNRSGFSNELCVYKKDDNILLVVSDNTNYTLDMIGVYKNKLEFYEWIEGVKSINISGVKGNMNGEYYNKSIVINMAQEICNLRGLDLTDDNIRLIVEEFS